MSTLIVGCGYLGRRVGEELIRRGEHVMGTVRSPGRAEEVARLGIESVILDVVRPESLGSLPHAERILYCVGFDRTGGVGLRTVSVEGLCNML